MSDISIRLSLPNELIEAYERHARSHQRTLEVEIAQTLKTYAEVDAEKPIVFNDVMRRELERMMGRNFSTPQELTLTVARALSLNLDGTVVALTPYLLERLKSRCIGMEFAPFMQMTVRRLLEEYVGLR